MKTIAQWIDLYEKKTGDKFERKEPFELVYFPKYGFCQIHVGKTSLLVWQMCGNAKWWFHYLQDAARKNKRKYITAFVRRPIKPYLRTFGFKIIYEDRICILAVDKQKREAIAKLRGNDKGTNIYTIRCEVK